MNYLFSIVGFRVFLKAFAFQLCLWLGLFFLDIQVFSLKETLLGSLFLAGAAGVASFSVESPTSSDIPDSGWRFLYLVLTERRTMLIMAGGTLALAAIAGWKLSESRLALEYSQGTGLAIRLASQTIYYEPVSPYGWQDTGIKFKEDETFRVTVSGRVSPGFLRSHEKLEANLAAIRDGLDPAEDPATFQWPFVGPEGYPLAWYDESNPARPAALQARPSYDLHADSGLTVQGLPHARLVGIILGSGEKPRRAGNPSERNYTVDEISDSHLLELSTSRDNYPIEFTASRSGSLWVTINDSDLVRWDNAGMFFLQVVK